MTIETLGIDIAKNVFQLHGVSSNGRALLKRRVMRDQLLAVVAQIERCTIVIEACTGAFCWARKFEALGHAVKIISPQYVKPFVRRQKNDGNDAEAICTAARQPHIPLVPKKTVEQQDIQALHRARQRMVNHRTAVVSQIRGLLLDRGFAMAKSITRARRLVPELLSAFFGMASYITAYGAKHWGLPPELALLAGTAVAAALGAVIGALAIRRQGIYFAMITLALAQMVYFFSLQTPKFTGGEDGIQAVPRGKLLGSRAH